ncbi:MAG: preprotein translocase subunit YajC [Actinobacteria bacterium]|nr:preprotein translocase subunit YajC [Actinomycetota bacterium]
MIAQAANNGNAGFLISLVLMVAIFYFLLIRPQQRRMRQQRALIEALDVGDEILTIGGLFGTIRGIQDDHLLVDLSPGTTVRLLKSAVARRVVDEVTAAEEDEEAGDAK